MFRIALNMLTADRAKFAGLLFGITFTSFLVTFAASYFCGFMTRGFSLITENPTADVWVMDPAVESSEQTINCRRRRGIGYAASTESNPRRRSHWGRRMRGFRTAGSRPFK